MWPEIHNVLNENRHELILSGTEISQRLNQDGLDANLFKLISLNLLRISETSLETVPDEVRNLKNLLSLLLHSNKLLKITPKIFDLTKLKVLDLSNNQIGELPDEIAQLTQLTSLNISSNKLEKLPSFQQNNKLSVLNAGHNCLQEFPDLCHCELVHLAEVKLNANAIANVPHEIKVLVALKVLDLSANKVTVIPGELSDCSKLKDVNLKENPVSDKRLLKLIEQCRSKQVLDYVRQNCPRKGTTGQSTGGGGGKKGKKSKKPERENTDGGAGDIPENTEIKTETVAPTSGSHQIVVLKTNEEEKTPNIQILDAVKAVRPFILACIIKNVKFDETTFRRFIQMQTKLHDSICEKRNAATIATHDLAKISGAGDLSYTACAPNELKIRPLNRGAPCTGARLFEQLRTEAENLRREKKRNTFSGVHRYLYLLEGRNTYPCLLDAEKKVISFPPITNSDDTKISLETDSILVEVTSASGQDVCKKVLDAVLQETLELGVGGKAPPDEKYNQLTIQKVKIVDLDGNLKAVYPSRADLNYETQLGINVLRE